MCYGVVWCGFEVVLGGLVCFGVFWGCFHGPFKTRGRVYPDSLLSLG